MNRCSNSLKFAKSLVPNRNSWQSVPEMDLKTPRHSAIYQKSSNATTSWLNKKSENPSWREFSPLDPCEMVFFNKHLIHLFSDTLATTNTSHLKMGRLRKVNNGIPTIHVQVPSISFRDGSAVGFSARATCADPSCLVEFKMYFIKLQWAKCSSTMLHMFGHYKDNDGNMQY